MEFAKRLLQNGLADVRCLLGGRLQQACRGQVVDLPDNASAVVVDQMRNLRAKTENNTQRLEVVAQELRNMGRRHNCLMVGLTQVGDSGRDKLVLNDGDIDGSNTGIPGACDVIMMVGSNDDFEKRDLRVVTFAKNKRGGDHGSVTVSVDRKLSRVMSYGRD